MPPKTCREGGSPLRLPPCRLAGQLRKTVSKLINVTTSTINVTISTINITISTINITISTIT